MALLEIENLLKTYRTPDGRRLTVVDVPKFQLGAGEQVALSGPSGTGKTTFLNLIAGILTADSGQVRLDGRDLSVLSEPERDRQRASVVGYIFQTFNLLQGFTCLENVLLGMSFGPGADHGRARGLLERVGLGDRLDYFPRQLSTGQQQRVAVARALANRPKLVLADEPTGNLDPGHASQAMDLIRGLCSEQGSALLLVSHDPSVLGRFARCESLARLNRATRMEGEP